LRGTASLALVRVEPVRLPCPVEETWAPFLSRFDSLDWPVKKVTALRQPETAIAAQQSAI
jgi:hypothetical protein